MTVYSPAMTLRELLIGEDIGSEGGPWRIFVGHQPDASDDCITLFDVGGERLARLMTGEVVTRPGLRVLIRSRTHEEGWLKVKAAHLALLPFTSQITPPLSLGVDQQRRFNFVIECRGLRVPA